MADDFKAGDRVRMRNGESGTIIHVNVGLAQIQLDNSLRKTLATAVLERLGSDENSAVSSGSPTPSQNTAQKAIPAIRVLLVEDDAAFARLIQAALTTSTVEFEVHVVDHLATAVTALDEKVFNLVLLDLNLPDSSDLQTLEAVVAASSVPIIVLTGREHEDVADKLQASGAEFVLNKATLKRNSLIELIRQAVSPHRKTHSRESFLPSVAEAFEELAESAAGIEHALAVFEQRRLDPAEDIAIMSAKSHLRKMKNVITKHRGG